MKVWYEDGLVKCLSEQCTNACPRFDSCIELVNADLNNIKNVVRTKVNRVAGTTNRKNILNRDRTTVNYVECILPVNGFTLGGYYEIKSVGGSMLELLDDSGSHKTVHEQFFHIVDL